MVACCMIVSYVSGLGFNKRDEPRNGLIPLIWKINPRKKDHTRYRKDCFVSLFCNTVYFSTSKIVTDLLNVNTKNLFKVTGHGCEEGVKTPAVCKMSNNDRPNWKRSHH